MSGRLRAWLLLHEKSCSSTFLPLNWFLFFIFCGLFASETATVNGQCFVQPASNCNVRTRSQQNAFQWALTARCLQVSYCWVSAPLLCDSCAPHYETNESYDKILFLFSEQEPNFCHSCVERKPLSGPPAEINTSQKGETWWCNPCWTWCVSTLQTHHMQMNNIIIWHCLSVIMNYHFPQLLVTASPTSQSTTRKCSRAAAPGTRVTVT